MRVPVALLSLLAALVLVRFGLEPIAAAAPPSAAACTPRPAVTVTVNPGTTGTLQATISAATAAGVTLQQIVFNAPTNALIDVPGRPPRDPSPAPVDLSGQGST